MNNSTVPKWRIFADIVMFTVGIAGAAWEIFYDHSENYFVYALILALLRVGTGLVERIADVLKK